MLANLTLEEREQRLSPIVDSIRLGPKCRWKLPDGNSGGLGLQPLVAGYPERLGP